jgi:hypothetical protein
MSCAGIFCGELIGVLELTRFVLIEQDSGCSAGGI